MNDELRAKNQKPGTPNSELRTDEPQLRMIAWELTRSCNLACVHCRASAAMALRRRTIHAGGFQGDG